MFFKKRKQNNDNSKIGELIHKGVIAYEKGDFNGAISIFNHVLDIDYNYDEAWLNKGASLHAIGQTKDAIKCLDRAIKVGHNNDKAWFNKGVILHTTGDKKGVKCLQKAASLGNQGAKDYLEQILLMKNMHFINR